MQVTNGSNGRAEGVADSDGERDARGVRNTGGMHVEPLLRETEKREVGNGEGGSGDGEGEGNTSGQSGLSIGQGSQKDRRTDSPPDWEERERETC